MKYIKMFEKFRSERLNEGLFSKLSEKDIEDILGEDDIDDAIRIAQDVIGQDDGGVAGIYFSKFDDADEEWKLMSREERLDNLTKYMELEDSYSGLADLRHSREPSQHDLDVQMREEGELAADNIGNRVRNVTDEVDVKVLQKLDDERDEIKVGDVVLATYFMGGMDTYEFEVERNQESDGDDLSNLGNADDNSYYGLDLAYHVVKKSTYDSAMGNSADEDMNGGHGRQTCESCGEDMQEGFVVDGNTYCSEECRRKDYTDEQYQDKYDSDDTDEAYWTEWR